MHGRTRAWPSVLQIPREVLAVLPLLAGSGIALRTLAALFEDPALGGREALWMFTAGPSLLDLARTGVWFLWIKSVYSSSDWLVPLVLALPVGVLADRTKSHALLYAGGTPAAGGAVYGALPPVPESILAGQLIMHVGFTVANVAALVYVVRRTPGGQRGRVLGLALGIAGLLSLVVSHTIGLAAAVAGWRAGLIVVVLFALAGVALARRYAPVIGRPRQSRRWIRNVVHAPGRLLLINLSAVAVGVLASVLVSVLVLQTGGGHGQIKIDVLAIPAKHIPTKPMPDFDPDAFLQAGPLWTLVSMLVICAVGIFSDRLGRLRLFVPSVFLSGVLKPLAAQTETLASFQLVGLLGRLSAGVFLLTLLLVVDRTPANRIGTALGTLTFVSTLGPAIILLPVHAAGDVLGTTGILLIWSAATLLALAFALLAGESAPSRRPAAPAAESNET
ncbi:MAG: MFS transporter [Chloroflexi bacterium]|nr:MFS transporter [Chloroflexota bacterium]